jgi:hypothetical protein
LYLSLRSHDIFSTKIHLYGKRIFIAVIMWLWLSEEELSDNNEVQRSTSILIMSDSDYVDVDKTIRTQTTRHVRVRAQLRKNVRPGNKSDQTLKLTNLNYYPVGHFSSAGYY